jgi:predicted nucleic acid-binding protein
MKVVSNTSPLTNLAAIGQFDLLCKLYGEIHIPDGVWDELNASGKPWPGSRRDGQDYLIPYSLKSLIISVRAVKEKNLMKIQTPKAKYIVDVQGKKTGVILTLQECNKLLEDLHDLSIIAARREEVPITFEEMRRRILLTKPVSARR